MTATPKPGVLDIVPYVAGRSHAPGHEEPHKLSSNESALGPSPKALEAYRTITSLERYPDGGAWLLRNAIGKHHGLPLEQIVCGNGSDELLNLIAKAYLQPGDEVLYSQYGFIVYKLAAMSNSAVPVRAPEKDFRTDVDAMLAAVTPRTRIVYLANPNNPTSTYIAAREVRRLHAGLPKDVLLVIDAAYAEYVHKPDYESGAQMVAEFDNVVMTRTFSKIYGLAGLRVGWAYGPKAVIDVLNRVRGPFNVSTPAQHTAIAALADRAHEKAAIAHNDKWRDWLTTEIRKLGIHVPDSVGNFVLLQFPAVEGHAEKDADAFLHKRGLILRPVANYGLPDCLRLTVGSEQANRAVVAALKEFIAS